MPQKHREKPRKLLSAGRWHFLKKFFAAQRRDAYDVIVQAPPRRMKICLRAERESGTFLCCVTRRE